MHASLSTGSMQTTHSISTSEIETDALDGAADAPDEVADSPDKVADAPDEVADASDDVSDGPDEVADATDEVADSLDDVDVWDGTAVTSDGVVVCESSLLCPIKGIRYSVFMSYTNLSLYSYPS